MKDQQNLAPSEKQNVHGERFCIADREMSLFAMCLGSLARGRTILEDFSMTDSTRRFASWLNEAGIVFEESAGHLSWEGSGLHWQAPTVTTVDATLALDSAQRSLFTLQLALMARDGTTEYTIVGDHVGLTAATELLGVCSGPETRIQTLSDRITITFGESFPAPTKDIDLDYLHRNFLLLVHLGKGESLSLDERNQGRDQLSRMAGWFGAPITIETGGTEEMDELSKRMARMQGVKTERRYTTSLQPCKTMSGRTFFVSGDVTQAAAWVLAATLEKGSDLTVKQVCLNQGRAGFFTALKRMGAEIEISGRKEKWGDTWGTLRVKPVKRLIGRRFGPETTITCWEEVPLLAVAAAFAEGETILRLPDSMAQLYRNRLEALAHNLRLAGCEVGVYEEGLVVRGKEELDGNDFDCANDSALAAALWVLTRKVMGASTIVGLECLQRAFPNWELEVK